jgi:hypothetical protein
MSASAATHPVADCTRLNATAAVSWVIASASRSAGTVSTSAATAQGNRLLVNSISGTTTLAPGGSAVATTDMICDTVELTLTSAAGAPTRRANAARARPTEASHGFQSVRPWRQSVSTAWSSSKARRGGRP